MVRLLVPVLVLGAFARLSAALDCPCDAARPETMRLRQCSLCAEAEKQPAGGPEVFFLKDANPRKANRMLALPRRHHDQMHPLADMDPRLRTQLWTAAIAKARELWGDSAWGLAYNGDKVRTQCHTHIHIGKLNQHVETGRFVVVSRPSQIPAPPGSGVWVHPVGKGPRMHVHLDEQICETVLIR
jgi:diadenosine tetraphosphate (Ap4A) HIT family hydrolase